jgi:quercetin dioxygenase-like cupin family protein
MEIKRSGSQLSGKGPAEWFTGTVRIDPLFSPPDPARVAGAHVTFEPGPARPGTRTRSARP